MLYELKLLNLGEAAGGGRGGQASGVEIHCFDVASTVRRIQKVFLSVHCMLGVSIINHIATLLLYTVYILHPAPARAGYRRVQYRYRTKFSTSTEKKSNSIY